MARRRLTILLATTLSTGLVVLPAAAGPLDAVTSTTEDVSTTVEASAEEVSESVDAAAQAVQQTVSDGTDGAVQSDVTTDTAPSDDDGSAQLEVDGGVTVGDQTVDVGEVTDPVEEAIDPDPAPSGGGDETTDDDPDPSPRGNDLGDTRAAGDDVSPADVPASDGSGDAGQDPGQSFGVIGRGGGSNLFGFSPGPGTVDVAPPQVANPEPPTLDMIPRVESTEEGDRAALAADPVDTDPAGGGAAAKLLAVLLVLGTGIAWKRTVDAV